MNFIQAKDGRLYPADRIVRIGEYEDRNREGIIEVEIEGYGTAVFYHHRIAEFLRQPVSVIAAHPETYIVRLSDEEPMGYWKMQVIGWSVSRDGNVYPITPDGVNDRDDHDHFILTHDGRVSQAEGASWDSLELFLKSQADAEKLIA